MSDSKGLNQIYLDARKELTDAQLILPTNSDEELAIKAAIDELDLANLDRIQAEYSEGTNKLNSLVTKLKDIKSKIKVNPVSGALEKVNAALGKINSLVKKFSELTSP